LARESQPASNIYIYIYIYVTAVEHRILTVDLNR
jgi:hypothetical protein